MKKRWLAMVLVTVVLIGMIPGASASGSLFFVGVNDDIPLLLPGDTAAYYTNGLLYAPYTVFDAAPGKINVSYDSQEETLLLFTMSQRILYNLKEGTMTDRAGTVSNVEIIYRNGMLYIPVEQAAKAFGLSVSLMNSQTGCVLLRFTNGSEIYDDEKFLSRSELFITHMLESYGNLSAGEIQGNLAPEQSDPEQPEFHGETTVYLAFTGNAVSQQTLLDLDAMDYVSGQNYYATFFLTAEQIIGNRDLVREIYAKGYLVGLTVEAGEEAVAESLQRANDALDRTIFCKTILVLLPQGTQTPDGYCVTWLPESDHIQEDILAQPEISHLLICTQDSAGVLSWLMEQNVSLLPLTETTAISGYGGSM